MVAIRCDRDVQEREKMLNPLHTLQTPKTRLAGSLCAILLACASHQAQAGLIQLDASQSQVTYSSTFVICDPFGCAPPAPQTFTLSGALQVDVQRKTFTVGFLPTDPTIEVDLIQFTPVALNLNGADAIGFSFPTFVGILNGNTYFGKEDPCTLPLLQGMNCMSIGPYGDFEATYDGHTLSVDGTDPHHGFFDGFRYRLVGQAITVPEPGGLALTALAGLAAIRRRRHV